MAGIGATKAVGGVGVGTDGAICAGAAGGGVIALGGGVIWLMYEVWYLLRHVEALGFGDVKMLAMIGAFIGWKLTLMTLMMASFSGTIVGVALIVSKRGSMKYALPFGTFLALGAAAAATIGQPLLDWYVALWQ